MLGTVINVGTVLAGSLIGISIGARLPERIRDTVLDGLGLLTILVGLQMALETRNILIVMGAILLGGLAGEVMRIDEALGWFSRFIESSLTRGQIRGFGEGFIGSSLVFCVGPMAILGSVQDGLSGDYRLLAVKSVLDGFASIAFAAGLGWGVSFSVIPILVYQGSITLFAGLISSILTDPMIAEVTATGGLIIVGIGFKLMSIKEIRLANFLPALVIAPLLVALVPKIEVLFR